MGPSKAAKRYGFSKQRYFQLRDAYRKHGAAALQSKTGGPKSNYRRTGELVRQVIRHRFLDPDATAEVIAQKLRQSGFDLLVPFPNQPGHRQRFQAIAPDQFARRWARFATVKLPYEVHRGTPGTYWQFVERYGERPEDWRYQAFLCTSERDEVEALTRDFPKRWHVEEFFNANQALGWNRAGTMNLNVRYGQMTMALIAQAVIHQLRVRLGEPYCQWDANHMAKDLVFGLEADVRVKNDTIVVTYYNAPNTDQLRHHYQDLPEKLVRENIQPEIPWLYDYKLDFRFR